MALREPSWHQHRLLQLDESRVNLHVFGSDCPEMEVMAYNKRKEAALRGIYERMFRAAGFL